MEIWGLLNPEHGPRYLLPSSLKNNPSIRSRVGDERFLQRRSPSTPRCRGTWGGAGNKVLEPETPNPPARHRPAAQTGVKPPTP